MFNRLPVRLVCLALALCPAILATAPAEAEWRHWNSGIEFGGGPFPPRPHALFLMPPASGEARNLQSCMDAEMLTLGLEDQGFDDVVLNGPLPLHRVAVEARSGYRRYVLSVDACYGTIYRIRRLPGGY